MLEVFFKDFRKENECLTKNQVQKSRKYFHTYMYMCMFPIVFRIVEKFQKWAQLQFVDLYNGVLFDFYFVGVQSVL